MKIKYVYVLQWYSDEQIIAVFESEKAAVRFARTEYIEPLKKSKHGDYVELSDPAEVNDGFDGVIYRITKTELIKD